MHAQLDWVSYSLMGSGEADPVASEVVEEPRDGHAHRWLDFDVSVKGGEANIHVPPVNFEYLSEGDADSKKKNSALDWKATCVLWCCSGTFVIQAFSVTAVRNVFMSFLI